MQFVNLGQAQIISAITSNNGDIAGVWAPNNYTLEEKAGAKYLCSGADAGAIVPGALVVRADYAKEHPKDVAKFLAVYPARLGLGQGQPGRSARAALDFYKQGGVEISDRGAWTRIRAAARLPLDEQLEDYGPRERRLDGRRLVHATSASS